jgi:hypothetical protein
MRQPIRALLATVVAVAAILIAAAASSSAATPPTAAPSSTSEHTPSTPGVGATCVIQHPDCNDMGFGAGGSEPGTSGSGDGTAPPTIAPVPTCGPTTNGAASGPDGTVATLPCIPGPERKPQPLIVVPRSAMVDVRPISFTSATVGPDDRTVDVQFWSGVEPCSVLDHVDVAYGTDTVTITLFEGSDPSAGMVACPDLAMLKQVTVALDQPLAGRSIVDGAK